MTDLQFSKEEHEAAQKQARTILTRASLVFRLATMHQLSNTAMAQPIQQLLESVGPILQRGEQLHLQQVGENFFLNREIIKLDHASFDAGQTLRLILERLRVQELAFNGPLSESELRDFLAAFQKHLRTAEPQKIKDERFPSIAMRLISKSRADALGGQIDERQNLLRSYALLALTVRSTHQRLVEGKPAQLARLRRAVHGVADSSVGHEGLLVGLTRLPTLTGPHFHLASVAALVLLMGRRLGLPRAQLTDVCMAAALHDVGRLEMGELQAETLDPERLAAASQRVPLRSALRICSGALSLEVLGLVAVAHEHTLPARAADARGPSGVARLVSVACAFDLMTSPPPPRRGLLPDQALRLILDKSDTRFDGRVARLFAATVGLYPVGTTVRLSSGATALVVEVPADPAHYDKPRLKILRYASGLPADFVIDLASSDELGQIVSSVDPIEEQISVPRFLLA